jgi:hypothetical protein
MLKDISIRFQWFWHGMDLHQNFLVHLLESEGYTVEVKQDKKVKVDIEFVSVFPPFQRKINEKIQRWKKVETVGFEDVAEKYILEKYPDTRNFGRRICLTGENLRPPLLQNYDSFLSFDLDTFGGRNAYLPIWYFDVDFFNRGIENRTGKKISIKQLITSRNIRELGSQFAISFIGNPHPIRMNAIQTFQEFKDIDLYGSAVNRPVRTKIEVAKNSIFSFCFENDLYPGYVTEKIVEAFACGNIPLYWGLFGDNSVFNKRSYLNLADFESLSHYRDHVLSLKKSEILEIANQPLLIKSPDLSGIVELITGEVANQNLPG